MEGKERKRGRGTDGRVENVEAFDNREWRLGVCVSTWKFVSVCDK